MSAPGSGTVVGEGAKLEWGWHRGLRDNEEFIVEIQPTSPGLSKSFWVTTRNNYHFTTGENLPPGRSIRWSVYVRIVNSENRITANSDWWIVVRS
jgi:hypothetical protein